jgi:hypothetical protein
MIGAHPITWNGGDVWKMIKDLSESAIMPVGALILLIVLVNDLIQNMVAGNQFENVGIGVFFKWFIKAMIGILLVSNVFDIASWLFTLGVYAGTQGVDKIGIGDLTVTIDVTGYELGEVLIMLVIAILTFLAVCLLLIAIIVTLAGRIIECFMYLAAAPIPMATYMNSEWRQMGNNWLRGMFALAFQGFFIVVALAIFTGLFANVVATVNANAKLATNGGEIIFQMLILFAYTLALTMTVLRSGQISKSIFGAS